jgi:HD-like signal output (HDOD) protein
MPRNSAITTSGSPTDSHPAGVESFDDVFARIEEISTLPHIAMRVLEVASNNESSVAQLRDIVETDAALSTRVIRCVNSAAFGLRHPITDLQRGISHLGFKQVRNLALTACVADLFQRNENIGAYQRTQLWRHLVSTAICARMIAVHRRMAQFEEAFLAGLLHDIGIILEDQYCHRGFVAVIRALDPTAKLAEVERAYLGFDHTMLGHRIGLAWNFPGPALDAIRHHHVTGGYDCEHDRVVACVAVANYLCTLSGTSSVGLALVAPPHGALELLGLDAEDTNSLAADLDEQLTQHSQLFDM